MKSTIRHITPQVLEILNSTRPELPQIAWYNAQEWFRTTDPELDFTFNDWYEIEFLNLANMNEDRYNEAFDTWVRESSRPTSLYVQALKRGKRFPCLKGKGDPVVQFVSPKSTRSTSST